jgi:hypothetical protein
LSADISLDHATKPRAIGDAGGSSRLPAGGAS